MGRCQGLTLTLTLTLTLIGGNRWGDVKVWLNTGTYGTPSYTVQSSFVDVGFYASPSCVDFDGDGDVDCFVGAKGDTNGDDASHANAEIATAKYLWNYRIESYCGLQGSFAVAKRRCMCFPGFSGVQCLDSCPGPGSVDGICWGHGACYTSGAEEGGCLCSVGYGGMDSVNRTSCDRCVTSWKGNYFGGADGSDPLSLECSLCPGGGTCAGHGVCNSGNTGDGLCVCDTGYSGTDCSTVDACPAGSGLAALNTCQPCRKGESSPSGTCMPCVANYYSDITGAVNCKACPLKALTLSRGSHSFSQCQCSPPASTVMMLRGGNATCETCPMGAICQGGLSMTPGPGHWLPSRDRQGEVHFSFKILKLPYGDYSSETSRAQIFLIEAIQRGIEAQTYTTGERSST